MNEIWKDVKGFEGFYQVSNLGKIKTLRSGVIKEVFNFSVGYYSFLFSKNGFSKPIKIHRVVALAFIDNPNNYPCVNHKDGNKLNNNVLNLEWCSHQQNLRHSYDVLGRKGTCYGKYGKEHNRSKPILQFSLAGEFIKEWENAYFAAKDLGLHQQLISKCCCGSRKQTGGFTWKHKV